MSTLELSPVERPAVRRAVIAVVEDLEMSAQLRSKRRGADDQHVLEMREEAAVLRPVAERLAGDQSPASSRVPARELVAAMDDEALRQVIGAAEELLDARFLETGRTPGREVAARYCTPKRAS